MFTIGFLNKQNKSNMSFNQDINFHRAAKHLRSSTHSSPQRMLSCPDPGRTTHRFKSVQTGSNISLNSACSSKDEGSSGEHSDHNHHHHHHHHEDVSGAFDRNQSLQSSFNSDHSSSRESDIGCQGSDDSPTISDVQPFTKSAFATSSPHESHSSNLIEMSELKNGNFKSKKKKKTKKSLKFSNSSASSVVSDGSNSSGLGVHQTTVVPSSSIGGALDSSAKDSSSSWYQFMMPSYKSRLSTFHSTFLNIPTTEALVDDFLCALHRDILLQGRLYVSVNYIAFYSNILGYETKVVIPFKDIKFITKATTIKLFHNAIEVYTFDGTKYFFTSFVSREKCFRVLKLLWDSASDLVDGPKLHWTSICHLIRQNYSTQTLGANLTDLENTDLEKHLSKGKSVRKRLQKKKDKLKSMNSSSDSVLSVKSQTEFPDGDDDDDEFEDTVEEEVTCEDVVDSSCRPAVHHQILVTENPLITQCKEYVHLVSGAISPAYHRVRQSLTKESTRVYLCYAMIIIIFCLHIHLLIRIGTVNERLEVFTNLAQQAMNERMHRQSLSLLAATNSQMVVSSSLPHNEQHLTTVLSTPPSPECSQCHFNLSPT